MLRALLQKEWIKLRYFLWIIPLMFAYASIDSALVLNTIQRVHGGVGLWLTLTANEPTFFRSFQWIIVLGTIVGFAQAWPEAQGKRLRILYHMPMDPERIFIVMLTVGLSLLLLTNALAYALLTLVMQFFYLPSNIIVPVLYAMVPYSLLSIISYLCVFAFFASNKMGLRALVLIAGALSFSLLWNVAGYSAFRISLAWYVGLSCGFIPLVLFVVLQAMDEPKGKMLYDVCRAVSLILVATLLCAVVPNQYWRAAMPELVNQRLYYSPVEDQFVRVQSFPNKGNIAGHNAVVTSLEDGTELNTRQAALALPILRAENLLKWGIFPGEIAGVSISLQEAKNAWAFFSYTPRTINHAPLLTEMMLESDPEGASFELPEDVFRVRHDGAGIEFLLPDDHGRIDVEKSQAFTAALQDAGFQFPVKAYGGNPNPRKEVDAGYVLVDAQGYAYQLQMYHGEPLCAKAEGQLDCSVDSVRGVLVSENRKEEFFGYIVAEHDFYIVNQNPLSIVKVPLKDFDFEQSYFTLWADPINKVISQGRFDDRESGLKAVAFMPDWTPLARYQLPMLQVDIDAMERTNKISDALFPIRIVQHTPSSAYALFECSYASHWILSLSVSALCTLFFIVFMRLRKVKVRLFDTVFILVFGLLGLTTIACTGLSVRFIQNYIRRS